MPYDEVREDRTRVIGERGKDNAANVDVARKKSQMRSFYKDKVGRSACSPLIVPALVTRRIRLLGYGRCDRVNGRSRPTASSQLDQTLHARNEKNYAALRRSSNFCMVDWHRSDWCNDSFGKRLRRRCTISIFTFGDRGKVATTSISDTSSCSQQWNLETRERVYTYAERKAEMSPSKILPRMGDRKHRFINPEHGLTEREPANC